MSMASEDNNFSEFIRRIRRGDQDAARELVQRYERELRIMARVRLTDQRLRRVLDSMDVCQSILANFFARAATGQFDLATPEQLVQLLAAMVRNKVTDYARLHQADRRDTRRLNSANLDELEVASPAAAPFEIAANAELLENVRKCLTKDELQIANLRRDGLTWDQIAERLHESPEALRKRYSRAVDRVIAVLGLDNSPEE